MVPTLRPKCQYILPRQDSASKRQEVELWALLVWKDHDHLGGHKSLFKTGTDSVNNTHNQIWATYDSGTETSQGQADEGVKRSFSVAPGVWILLRSRGRPLCGLRGSAEFLTRNMLTSRLTWKRQLLCMSVRWSVLCGFCLLVFAVALWGPGITNPAMCLVEPL